MRLIDADAIIEVMKKCAENPENEQALLCYRYTQKILEEAPTVEPASPWHRVEEPPKIGVPVLVTFIGYNSGETRCDLLAAYDGIAWRYWDDDMLDEVMVEITHWMPLPEPPKEV